MAAVVVWCGVSVCVCVWEGEQLSAGAGWRAARTPCGTVGGVRPFDPTAACGRRDVRRTEAGSARQHAQL